MRTIIAGSRSITDYAVVRAAIDSAGFAITEIVSGHAGPSKVGNVWLDNVDRLGERYSREVLRKEPKLFPADWKRYGKAAGFRRNVQMAEYAEALIAVWTGGSRGTKHMIDVARSHGLKVFVAQTVPLPFAVVTRRA